MRRQVNRFSNSKNTVVMQNTCPGVNLSYLKEGKSELLNFKYIITDNNGSAG